ncbi:MAG: TonB-dependent receptor, partial [Candidatus Eremiobacteraeota bacterium]|nr:TonB-dependent receptor [Candidatus Eremiobacteraeota bacterium]
DVSGAQLNAFIGPGATQFSQSVRAYDLHGRASLGAGSLAADVAVSNNSVDYTGGANSLYDVSHQDKRNTVSLSWGRTFERSEFAFGGYARNESLTENGVDGVQSQRIASWFVRGAAQPSSRLRLNGAAYLSNYTSFGSSLDARFGVSYDLDDSSALRFSVGTGFRAPLLIERYVFPASALPPPNVDCVIVGQGNPNEKPEHATEYELGYGRKLSAVSNLDVSAYRTNLRDPIENFYPGNSCGGPPAFSYPINIANVVYEGGAIRFVQRFDAVTLNAQYGLNIAYPYNFPGTISNPTSGAFLVNSQQFIGIPQQVGSLGLDWHRGDWHGAFDVVFRGRNNELNQGSYTLMNTGIGKRFGKADLTFAVANLGNDVSGRFTAVGQGVPYLGNAPGSAAPVPIATNRYFVEPRSFRLIFTFRN